MSGRALTLPAPGKEGGGHSMSLMGAAWRSPGPPEGVQWLVESQVLEGLQ